MSSDAGHSTWPFLLLMLPPALQHDILGHLSAFDLGTLNLACKATHTCVSAIVTNLDISVNRDLRASRGRKCLQRITNTLCNLLTKPFPCTPAHQHTPATHLPAVQHLTLRLHTFCCDFLSWFTTRHLPTLQHLTTLSLQLNTAFTTKDWRSISHLLQQCSNLTSLEIGFRVGYGNWRLVLKDDPLILHAATHVTIRNRLPLLLPSLLDDSVMCTQHPRRIIESLLTSAACCQLLHVLDTTKSYFSVKNMIDMNRSGNSGLLAPPWFTTLHELHVPCHPCPWPSELAHLTRLTIGWPVHETDSAYLPHIGWITTLLHLELHNSNPYAALLDALGRRVYSVPLPDSWSQLRSLHTLLLSGGHVTPSSPLWTLTSLKRLSLLEHVQISSAPVANLRSPMSALTALTSLCIPVSADLTWLTHCLSALPITVVDLTLDFGIRNDTAADFLAGAAGGLTRLCNLSSFALRLESCPQPPPQTVPVITDLTSLQRLVLGDCGLQHADLADLGALQNLTHLTLSGDIPPATSSLWHRLDEAGRLKELCCGTGAGGETWNRKRHCIAHWPDVIPSSLTSLQARVGGKAAALPDQLSRCIQLRVLLVDTVATDFLHNVDVLVRLTALQQLRLRRMKSTCVSCIDGLTRLTSVVISDGGLCGKGGLHGKWPRLKAQGRLKEVLLEGFRRPPMEDRTIPDFSKEW